VLAVGAVRAARQTVLPLWAEHLGLGAEQTSLIFGIAGAVDMALFYPSGKVMDQFGRLSIAVPSMLVLGGAMIALPLTRGAVSLTVVAMIMSLGNGIGSGMMMTLGADAAPADGRTRFLAVWRLFNDSGNAAGPVVVSLVATAASLGVGVVAIGSVGLFAAAALGRWVPRYSPYATRASLRQ
jgi:MFS family permease